MTETRFPASGTSAEYGDIVISDVNSEVTVSISHAGSVISTEKYTPDSSDQIAVRDIGELAMLYYNPSGFLSANGAFADPVTLSVSIVGNTTITKSVSIYPCVVDFSGTLDVALLKKIPLSRATKKNTAYSRKEYISFYGGKTVKVYAVYMGDTADQATTADLIILADPEKIYLVDVSPAVIATLINKPVDKLVYYNVYTDVDCIIRYVVSRRYQQFEQTFVFRNCFGAQESFACTGDETEIRKWERTFGNINAKKIDISRNLENSVKVSTGYITNQEVEVVEDLLNSDEVCLLDEAGFQKVTVLDQDFEITSRKDELKSVSFTYRLAQKNQFRTSYKAFKKPRIFTPDFNNTFE